MRAAIAADHPGFDLDSLGPDSWTRLERLAAASPLYAGVLRQRPELCLWLEDERNLRTEFRYQALIDEWGACAAAGGNESGEHRLARLRRWRRQMSLRIAYRSVNGLVDEPATVGELSRLAEFCIRHCLELASSQASDRLGDPWEERMDRPARFCVLALGKLGGGELNFSSDIDLIYCYEGDGFCRRGGDPTETANVEYFTRIAEAVTRFLSAQTADGFLFRVDVRLRPEGAWGPLVHSLSALENYYSTAGQTWERLALIKARPVAGDLALGAELLEDLHDFRYPRRPPPALLAEVAAMKRRAEREGVGAAAIDRDLKRGPGGIREVEFVAQSLQLLHAGRFPFLQTHVTATALDQLARYGLLEPSTARQLEASYWLLRRVEHRLQMRDESQTHELPTDPQEREALATSLGFASVGALDGALAEHRGRVRAVYEGLFSDRPVDREFEEWWDFLTTERTPDAVAARLARWFGSAPDAAAALRGLASGEGRMPVTRESVERFRQLVAHLDGLAPDLGRPLDALVRLERFAERYGPRHQFLAACAANPQFFRVLALLCDRSAYAVELLCAHPEILEEVLRPEILRRRKSGPEIEEELSRGVSLWLYVRAEQMRHAIGELLGFRSIEEMESELTGLADAVFRHLRGLNCPLVVALGKYGGGELSFGSDLDLLFVGREASAESDRRAVEELREKLGHPGPLGPAFDFDLRLRPHGDAGPVVTTIRALEEYHSRGSPSGSAGAQTWEKQILVRARAVAGPPAIAAEFRDWVDSRLYGAPLCSGEEEEIWSMLARIEHEREPVDPPERAIKTGPGGLVDIEFAAQVLQLRHGHEAPELRVTGTRAALRALSGAGYLPASVAERLIEHYNFLKGIELELQRDANRSVGVLPSSPAERAPLARWLGFPDEASFWNEHVRRLAETRKTVEALRLGAR